MKYDMQASIFEAFGDVIKYYLEYLLQLLNRY